MANNVNDKRKKCPWCGQMEAIYEGKGDWYFYGHKITGNIRFYGTLCNASHKEVEFAEEEAWKKQNRFEVEMTTTGHIMVTAYETPEKLLASEWRFRYNVFKHELKYIAFYKYIRKTTRHGWVTVSFYDNRGERDSLEHPPLLPPEVSNIAVDYFKRELKVGTRS